MSAIDVLGKLDGFDVNLLGSLQRVLLVTDGTLTEILEAYFAERIVLVKVAQQVIPATASHALLNPIVGETLIERKILLQGTRSRSNYVYAESLVAVDRLAPIISRCAAHLRHPARTSLAGAPAGNLQADA